MPRTAGGMDDPLKPLTNEQVRLLRAAYARDLCSCRHLREEHYAASGATVACRAPGCRCSAYAWSGETFDMF